MHLATGGQKYSIFLARRKNTWYTVKDGDWTDPTIWISNALDQKNVSMPKQGDDIFIYHNVRLNVTGVTNPTLFPNNVTVSATGILRFTGNQIFSISGDLVSYGQIDLGGGDETIILYGSNNKFTNVINPGTSLIYYRSKYYTEIQPITYYGLFSHDGDRKLLADLTVNSSFQMFGGKFDVNNFNMTFNNAAQFNCGSQQQPGLSNSIPFSMVNTGSSILFIGNANLGNSGPLCTFNFNPSTVVEFRGGIGGLQGTYIGACAWNFTTNNQTVRTDYAWSTPLPANISIQNVTVTTTDTSLSFSAVTPTGTINGTTPGSTLIVGANSIIHFPNASIMATGTFAPSTFASTSRIGFTGATTIPYTTFGGGLDVFGGVSAALGGNTTIGGALTINSASGLQCNGYTLSIAGASSIAGSGVSFSQNGAGKITFGGNLGCGGLAVFNFSGNPTIELQGGMNGDSMGAGNNIYSSNWQFTTNNQTINTNFKLFTFIGTVTVVGAIRVDMTAPSQNSTITFQGGLNGTVAGSIFTIGATVNVEYQNATEPMQTGALYANQGTGSVFRYSLAGAQNIKTPTDPVSPGYQNLTLKTSGVKTLLGNVSVKGTYLLSAPATLNLNGFALTNP